MAKFIIRVVLHSAVDDDYINLHHYMDQEGFKRTMVGVDNIEYYLPDTEYFISGAFSSVHVVNKARSATKKVGKRHEILVSQALSIGMCGLAPV